MRRNDDVSLSILVVDADEAAAQALKEEAAQDQRVGRITIAHNAEKAQQELRSSTYDAVVIDPISIGADSAAQFFHTAMRSSPEIVFVLYVDTSEVDLRRSEFYSGDRQRLVPYCSLDKRTPVAEFPDEVCAMLSRCACLLDKMRSAGSLTSTGKMVQPAGAGIRPAVTPERGARGNRAVSLLTADEPVPASRRTVFLSHRLAESEYVDGLTRLLEQEGFTVSTGSPVNTFASQAILQRISESDYFVCLMTRDKKKVDGSYTTNPWLLEEKGAALALKKPVVMLIEHGVDEFGGLQGDWQRIHFGPKGYLSAALQAVSQLNSYVGVTTHLSFPERAAYGPPDAGIPRRVVAGQDY